jgi:hypothetical protein
MYLGVPLGAKKKSLIKYPKEKGNKLMELIEKIKRSCLAPNPTIHCLQALILPKLNYLSPRSILDLTDLE